MADEVNVVLDSVTAPLVGSTRTPQSTTAMNKSLFYHGF